LLERGDFAGRAGDTLLVAELPGIKASRVLLTGLGAKKSYHRRSWRKAWAAAAAALARTRIASCALAIDRPEAKQLDDYYFGRAGACARQALRLAQRAGARCRRHAAREDGVPARGCARQPSGAAFHRARAPRPGQGAAADRAGRQGRYFR